MRNTLMRLGLAVAIAAALSLLSVPANAASPPGNPIAVFALDTSPSIGMVNNEAMAPVVFVANEGSVTAPMAIVINEAVVLGGGPANEKVEVKTDVSLAVSGPEASFALFALPKSGAGVLRL